MQNIGFGNGFANSAISSNTKDAARITIEISLYYTYILHKLPAVALIFRYMCNGQPQEDISKISQSLQEKLWHRPLTNTTTKTS
jgi:hypothetical protein